MVELKTLKNMGLAQGIDTEAVPKWELKQEGIKYHERYFHQALNAEKRGDESTKSFCLGHCAMIKELLDLTEDDLK